MRNVEENQMSGGMSSTTVKSVDLYGDIVVEY